MMNRKGSFKRLSLMRIKDATVIKEGVVDWPMTNDKSKKRSSSFNSLSASSSPRSPRGSRKASPKGKSPSPRDTNPSYEMISPRGVIKRTVSVVSKGIEELSIRKIHDIARGGSGARVYKAKIDGGSYCVKELKITNSNPQDVEELIAEIELLRQLPSGNSHLVDYIGYQRTETSIQVIMGLYDGTLFDYIKMLKSNRKRFSTKHMLIVCDHVLTALSVLHNRRLIHRDIKSTNILYEGDTNDFNTMRFVVTDFGESKILSSKNCTNTLKGTPAWIAPEMFNNKPYSFSADMWSFAMVIYEMMELKFPYYKHAFVTLAIIDGIIPKIDIDNQILYPCMLGIYTRCTNIDPEMRPCASQSLKEVKTLLLNTKYNRY